MNPRQIFAQDLRGHEYLQARHLVPTIKRITPPTWQEVTAPFQAMLPAVQQICANERERRNQKIRRVK